MDPQAVSTTVFSVGTGKIRLSVERGIELASFRPEPDFAACSMYSHDTSEGGAPRGATNHLSHSVKLHIIE
jgi:hypothetical protein